MKTVFDYQPFKDAQELLVRLEAEKQSLEIEQAELLQQLSFSNPNRIAAPDSLERAKAILEGKPHPGRADEMDSLRQRELSIRHKLEIIRQALRVQPGAVERQRNAARAAALKARAKTVEAVCKAMAEAQAALAEAIEAEDRLIADLVAGGFGGGEPVITRPEWLNRELFKAQA